MCSRPVGQPSGGDTLYFAAGIHDEADGLFGKLTAVAGRDR